MQLSIILIIISMTVVIKGGRNAPNGKLLSDNSKRIFIFLGKLKKCVNIIDLRPV